MKNLFLKNLRFAILLGVLPTLVGCQTGFYPDHRPPLPKIDHIVVEKSQRTITVFKDGRELAQYYVSLSKSPVGHKEMEGDHKTPEGIYSICGKNPASKYYKALTISYPNRQDQENAARNGVSPGGEIQIHGYDKDYGWVRQGHSVTDGSRGCIVLTNPEMEQIYAATKIGTSIEIRP